jgi:hypothetical protein
MPTVLRVGPFRFFFYAGDGAEPPHVHVERDDSEAKFWLDPVRSSVAGVLGVTSSHGSGGWWKNTERLLESWNEFFNG